MFNFFDFLYLSICQFYKANSDGDPEGAGFIGIAGLQTFNVCSLIEITNLFILGSERLPLTKLSAGITFVLLLIFNYIRYIRIDKYSMDKIDSAWKNKTKHQQNLSGILQTAYYIFSFVIFFGLMLYSGSKKM